VLSKGNQDASIPEGSEEVALAIKPALLEFLLEYPRGAVG
jgi:hypothetical protein